MVRERTSRGGGECAGHSRQVQCIRRARSLLCRPRPCQKVAVSVSVGTKGTKGGFSGRPSFFPEENRAATVRPPANNWRYRHLLLKRISENESLSHSIARVTFCLYPWLRRTR